jgi:ABC-type dipeptide/oligopeptide/nickel transport system ATPase subunit
MLTVENLCKSIQRKAILHHVSLRVRPGEVVGLIGKSGSGKSTLARCIVGLEKPDAGDIQWYGRPLRERSVRREAHGSIQMVFQDPRNSLNPVWTIKRSIMEALRTMRPSCSRQDWEQRCEALIHSVGLAADHLGRYPHELSTGQCQRVCLARALAPEPAMLVLDEPLSALDVSIQAQMLELLKALQQSRNMGYLFISHDIAVVANLCQRVLVMENGTIVEEAAIGSLLTHPTHPYTRSLLRDTLTLPSYALRPTVSC